MRTNPLYNAIVASGYIALIGLFFSLVEHFKHDTPDTILAPIAMLSLLVFSVATMGFLFFYQPLILLLDGKREEAVAFFFKTLTIFGVLTAALFALFTFI